MNEYADELMEDATATYWTECQDCGREIDENQMCTWDEPHADGFREITVCEGCWLKRDRKMSEQRAA